MNPNLTNAWRWLILLFGGFWIGYNKDFILLFIEGIVILSLWLIFYHQDAKQEKEA